MTLASHLHPGDRIFVAGSSNEPTGLLSALRADVLPERLHFVQFPIAGYNGEDFTAWHPTFTHGTFFMTPALRKADRHRLQFLPMQMRHVYDYLARDIDVVLTQAARDRNGVLRFGPNVDFLQAALGGARALLLEVNDAIVAPAGGLAVDESRVTAMVSTDRPPYYAPAAVIDDVSRAIGERIASLVQDGDCLQTGIGAIPAAILDALSSHNDLGLHGGLIDDGGMRLIARGVVTGRCKAIDTGHHVTGMALGSAALYDWLADQPDVIFRGANYTHEVSIIRQLDNFVSVNSAVEIDLFGQVNAEFAGGRQISGTGGSIDFMRGARASRGGRSIVAMPATARAGAVSRIVNRVELVTAARTDVDIVVTEYGVARLRETSSRERAMALVELAAPEFREALREQAHAIS
ncbi:MAG: acetyl-CoA hydrolase/transferase family protein [Pseudomonadales bacterium]|nr:acetyl-CoA hydrolase/transferase family protein [Pseudomonadales bacterium]MCP5182364.1 acetyl-CoA hydrolase/transferase family protein [Pseudomonadales bacterium]